MQSEETPLSAANDAFLARLEQPNAYKQWDVEVELAPGLFIDTVFQPDEDAEPGEGLERARTTYLATRADLETGKRIAAEHLLDTYNDNWSDEDEPIEAEEFMARMTPQSIVIYSDGSVELFYDDGGMFLGHVILVSLNADGQTRQATIAG